MNLAARPAGLPWPLLGNALVLLALLAIVVALLGLHTDPWWLAAPRSNRWFLGAAALVAYVGACAWLLARHRPPSRPASAHASSADTIRVVYASQTGFAHLLAMRSADSLRAAGADVQVMAIESLQESDLRQGRALFVVSTTGEGDPPDHALGFVRRFMSKAASLSGLHYAVLALGDREYSHFCGFGQQLDDWLRQHGAGPLFDRVEVDNADESALRHWQHHLGQLGGVTDLPDWDSPRYEDWTLAERHCVNPGSVGGAAFHIALHSRQSEPPRWQAGDIAEIGPRNAPRQVAAFADALGWDLAETIEWQGQRQSLGKALAQIHLPAAEGLRGTPLASALASFDALPHREYSIASIPQEGGLHLLVRRMLRPDGSPGLGSGWLCEHAEVAGTIALRIRENANFHPPAIDRPMILIGNGTGIAGLRAHLAARVQAGARRNWLLFGERNADRDFFYRDQIQAWQAQGALECVDLAFSRDQPERIYVQDALRRRADQLRQWIAEGAVIYVCGSLDGMAPGVDSALRDVLGEDAVEELRLGGRYRRDVY